MVREVITLMEKNLQTFCKIRSLYYNLFRFYCQGFNPWATGERKQIVPFLSQGIQSLDHWGKETDCSVFIVRDSIPRLLGKGDRSFHFYCQGFNPRAMHWGKATDRFIFIARDSIPGPLGKGDGLFHLYCFLMQWTLNMCFHHSVKTIKLEQNWLSARTYTSWKTSMFTFAYQQHCWGVHTLHEFTKQRDWFSTDWNGE
jgi:hypothetical protein